MRNHLNWNKTSEKLPDAGRGLIVGSHTSPWRIWSIEKFFPSGNHPPRFECWIYKEDILLPETK